MHVHLHMHMHMLMLMHMHIHVCVHVYICIASYRELRRSYGVPRPVERIQRLLLHVRVTGFARYSRAFPSRQRHLWGSRAS